MITTPVLEVPEEIITTIVEPSAFDVDVSGAFPRAAVTALGEWGLLGLLAHPQLQVRSPGCGWISR